MDKLYITPTRLTSYTADPLFCPYRYVSSGPPQKGRPFRQAYQPGEGVGRRQLWGQHLEGKERVNLSPLQQSHQPLAPCLSTEP